METPPTSSEEIPRRHWSWIAFGWGFAEATFFFVVPDVFLTRLALRDSLPRALLACLSALGGALLGGTLLWLVANQHEAATNLLRTFGHLPGINRDIIATTGQALYDDGLPAMWAGGVLGHPYKLFAVHAGVQQFPLGGFLLVSAGARLARFALTTTLAWLAGLGLKRWPKPRVLRLHALGWLCFYALYFLIIR